MTFRWSSKPFYLGLAYSAIVCLIVYFFELKASLPWQPLSLIGIAVAFYLGFKNNSSYDRTWEGRKIWGSIVNNSRSFGAACVAFIRGANDDKIKKELIYRHTAWLTALRFQLRLGREWEHTENRENGLFSPSVCEAYTTELEKLLIKYISKEELKSYGGKANMATQILKKQSVRLQELRDQDYFTELKHVEFHELIVSFYADQGKSERIKNFPFPRQYASTALWLTFVFCAMVPWGLVDVFSMQHNLLLWLCPLISAIVIWIFFLMEKIGDYSENPFEGTYNDVPISSIARGIEIDLREMIDDEDIPEALKPVDGFLL